MEKTLDPGGWKATAERWHGKYTEAANAESRALQRVAELEEALRVALRYVETELCPEGTVAPLRRLAYPAPAALTA